MFMPDIEHAHPLDNSSQNCISIFIQITPLIFILSNIDHILVFNSSIENVFLQIVNFTQHTVHQISGAWMN